MKTRKLTRAAMIAAVYVVLCLVLQPLGFGAVQMRVSEALTVLVVLCPEAVVGVTLGCFIANLLGSTIVDVVVGTSVTLVAALISYRLRNVRWKGLAIAASLPPVILNAVFVGAMITILEMPGWTPGLMAFNMFTVGLGQLLSCSVLGVGLVWVIEKNPALRRMFGASMPVL